MSVNQDLGEGGGRRGGEAQTERLGFSEGNEDETRDEENVVILKKEKEGD